MATPHRSLWRVLVLSLAAASGGCAARASYVYEEPVVYERRARVYVAPPPVYYHDHPVERRYYVQPRVYRVPVHKAPSHTYRAPAARHHHHRGHHDSRHDDDRRERRHERRHRH